MASAAPCFGWKFNDLPPICNSMTRQSFSLILASLVGVLVTAYVVECGSALNQPTLLSGPILWLCSWFSDVQLAGRFLMCLTCIAAASLGFGVFVLTSRLRLSLRTGALSALSIIALSYLRPISTRLLDGCLCGHSAPDPRAGAGIDAVPRHRHDGSQAVSHRGNRVLSAD